MEWSSECEWKVITDQLLEMSRDMLDKLCATGRLSSDGCSWLKAYLDPFHDEVLSVKGMPDDITGKSVTVCVRKRINVTAPVNAAGGNWDCHVALTPVLYADDSVTSGAFIWRGGLAYEGKASGGMSGAFVPVATATSRAFQGVTVWSDAAGLPTFCEAGGSLPTIQTFNISDFVTNQENNANTAFRMVAGGFEVENTTALLTENGDVTVYRQGQAIENRFVMSATSSAATTRAYVGMVESRVLPPQTVDKAVSLVGSRSWSAKEGCYVPFRLTNIDVNPIAKTTAKGILLSSPGDYPASVTGPNYLSYTLCQADLVPGGVFTITDLPAVATHSFDTSGAYFTGLSNSTTLSVYLRLYIEIFPFDDEKMVAMAAPSPSSDPLALELAQRTALTMPSGVMRKDNDAGDFFRSVLKVASKVLPVIAPMAGNYSPLVNAAGAAAGTAAKTMEKKKKKPSPDNSGRVLQKTVPKKKK